MNLKLTLTSLIFSAALPVFAVAATPGKVGSVTVVLTTTSTAAGFKDSDGNPTTDKLVSVTSTLAKSAYKTVTIKAKYSNKEFTSDLIAKGTLTGVVADWSLKYVESEDFNGVFALNTDGVTIVYLGGDQGSGSTVINVSDKYGQGITENISYSMTLVDAEAQKTTFSGSYSETDCVFLDLLPSTALTFSALAIHNHGASYKGVYDNVEDLMVSSSYSIPASSFDSVVGYCSSTSDGPFISGSIKISALKDTADVSIYQTAYNNAHNG